MFELSIWKNTGKIVTTKNILRMLKSQLVICEILELELFMNEQNRVSSVHYYNRVSFMSRFTFTFQASAEGVFFAGYSTMKVILPRQDQLKEECSTESQVRNYWENLLYNSKNTIISVPEWYLEESEVRLLSKTQSMQTCTFPLNTEKFGTMWSKGSLATLRHQDFQLCQAVI